MAHAGLTIFALVLLCNFHLAFCLSCYKCNSTASVRDFACQDPIYTSRVHKRICPKNDKCAKIVGRINGITATIRDCYRDDESLKFTSRIPYYDQVAFDAKIYFCKTDLCNASPPSSKLQYKTLTTWLSMVTSSFILSYSSEIMATLYSRLTLTG